jgi:pyruvate dehydrogenase E1 component alpha subunit
MIEEFNPLNGKMLQVMDEEGKIVNAKWKPDIPDEKVLEACKFMLFARTADRMAVSYQRQGRMYTYPPNLGQEAISVGAGLQMRREDWLVPAFRELGAWLLKGATLKDVFLYWGGHEDGSRYPGAPNMLPSSVPIASQLPHAVGIGYALKYLKKEGIVFAFCGDGATSEGDFHEALNFAGVWKVPVLFIVQNNQYAISVPVAKQTASRSLAIKSIAYGIDGIQVDGNDFFAVYAAVQDASANARAGKGPTLIEAMTFRRGAHTTSDDPTLYRTTEEEKKWEARDPLQRLKQYLAAKGLWDEKEESVWIEQYQQEVDARFSEAENYPPYKLEDAFRYLYEEMPEELKRQQASYEKFLNRKESGQ